MSKVSYMYEAISSLGRGIYLYPILTIRIRMNGIHQDVPIMQCLMNSTTQNITSVSKDDKGTDKQKKVV